MVSKREEKERYLGYRYTAEALQVQEIFEILSDPKPIYLHGQPI
jgi:hypothetical protein